MTEQTSFWTEQGAAALIAAVAALAGVVLGQLVGPLLTHRRERKKDLRAALRTAVSDFLAAGEDLLSGCNDLVGMQREAFRRAGRDAKRAIEDLEADSKYQEARRELATVTWRNFWRQCQRLLVLPDVDDDKIAAVRKRGDHLWGLANQTAPDRSEWAAPVRAYQDASEDLVKWARDQFR